MTLHQYFTQELKAGGNINHQLRVTHNPVDDSFSFYIHPSHSSGTTADFILFENPGSGFDLLMPQDFVRPVDSAKFRKFMEDNGVFRTTWICGCGAINGVNLAECSLCKRQRGQSK